MDHRTDRPAERPRRRTRRRLATALASLIAVAGACTAEPEDAATPGSTLAERSSDQDRGTDRDGAPAWTACEDELLSGLDCATLAVPLDHAEPDGDTVDIALARQRAADPDRRIGSLFINPGGPGASGVDLVPQLASVLDDAVLDRFDIVGFDPRGVGRSTAVRCIDDPATVNALDADPDTPEEIARITAEHDAFVQACTERHGDLLPHLSTADTARDLDRLREAVGDEQLTYLGFSYGTELGATYATLFPDSIRVLVLDGAVGPNLSDDELALTQAQGFERAFDNFVDACRDDIACAARPDAEEVYDRVRAAVEAAPIPVSTDGEQRDLAIGDFQIGVVSALYDQALWAFLARGLVDADNGDGAMLLALSDLYHERKPDGTYPNAADANVAISCADTTERGGLAVAQAAAERFAAEAPRFGAQLGWGMLSCEGWPAAAQPLPTLRTSTEAPILVIGTVNDPATPYEWAGQLDAALKPASRLLTWEGEGHTAYLKSDCVTEEVDALLLELTEPDDGTTCPADADLEGAFAGIAPDLRDALMQSGGLDEETADCVAAAVSEQITPGDLVALYANELPESLTRLLSSAVTRCAGGG